MTLYKDSKEKRKIIMDYYLNPKHKGNIANVDAIEKFSIHCADKTKVYFKFDGDVLSDVKHDSEGCAIFIASMDLFLDLIIGKTKLEIKDMVSEYEIMINKSGDYNRSLLTKLVIFDNVKKHLNRLLCANIISEILKQVI